MAAKTKEAAKASDARPTKAMRALFLEALGATASDAQAAKAAGATRAAFDRLRERDPAFAEACRAALATGYERIEAALMRRALGRPAEAGEKTMDADLAMKLLERHRAALDRAGKVAKAAAFRAPRDAAAAALLAKLGGYARRRSVRDADEATPAPRQDRRPA